MWCRLISERSRHLDKSSWIHASISSRLSLGYFWLMACLSELWCRGSSGKCVKIDMFGEIICVNITGCCGSVKTIKLFSRTSWRSGEISLVLPLGKSQVCNVCFDMQPVFETSSECSQWGALMSFIGLGLTARCFSAGTKSWVHFKSVFPVAESVLIVCGRLKLVDSLPSVWFWIWMETRSFKKLFTEVASIKHEHLAFEEECVSCEESVDGWPPGEKTRSSLCDHPFEMESISDVVRVNGVTSKC